MDVRILAATNRDLEQMSAAGTFRPDLLFRLNAITLRIPPLRERVEEIEPLCHLFLEQANHANGCSTPGFAPEVLSLLRQYGWPGNIRELKNVIERAVVLAGADAIQIRHLAPPILEAAKAPAPVPAPRAPAPVLEEDPADITAVEAVPEGPTAAFKDQVRQLERALIGDALLAAGGNKAAAARALQLSPRTLKEKIRQDGITLQGHDPMRAARLLARLDRVAPRAEGLDYWGRIGRYEVALISQALGRNGGNKSQTARALRMPLETLKYKLRKYGVRSP